MNILYLTPYQKTENQDYPLETKIIIRATDFANSKFQDGKSTFSFIGCRFKKLLIENTESIDFGNISIDFFGCFIEEINIENITTTNVSLYFGSSLIQGRIKSQNISGIEVNNSLLHDSLFLLNLNRVRISYTEENIFPRRWKKLFDSLHTNFETVIKNKNSYYLYDCKNITFSINEKSVRKSGFYLSPFPTTKERSLGYYLTQEEKHKLILNLYIKYSAEIENKLTKIINAKLSSLSLSGFSTGEVQIENTRLDNFYIREFSTQLGAVFYNIKPYRHEHEDKKLEIHTSNLDKVTFDNFSFDDFTTISLYRNKFGQSTSFISCNFPDTYKGFEKFKTIENIHYPERKDDNYYKIRYETFLQIKKVLENSGNYYESQKLQAVSNEALRKIEKLPYWDRFILRLNNISNTHGLSITKPFKWIIGTSVCLYVIYLWSLGRMFTCNDIDWNLFGYYFSFLDITHRTDFLVTKTEINGLSLFVDYLNKVLIGFFIYQFIAAFRKYGRK